MTTDQSISLLKAIAGLIGVLVWPALLVFLIVRFRGVIGDFLGDLSELSVKAGGVEATAKRREEAVAALGAAIANRESGSPEASVASDPSEAVAALERALPNARAYRRIQGAMVLWVDDRPDNNRFERQSLAALGVDFTLSTSTQDALARLNHRTFDLIISDMGRPPDPRAGYALLDELRSREDSTPFIIYAGSKSPEHVAEARRHGAIGCTNSPSELIELVTQSLMRAR